MMLRGDQPGRFSGKRRKVWVSINSCSEPKNASMYRPKGVLRIMVSKIVCAALTFSMCAISSPPQQVPLSSPKVYVVGEVSRPGTYALDRPATALKVLVDAGGFTAHAAVDKIEIVRGKDRMKFDYVKVVQKGARAENIVLQDGDIIVVP
jgi:hypothetical protein